MKLFVNLFCHDIAAQLAFYMQLLGLPEDEHSRSPIYRAVRTDRFQFGFHAPAAYGVLSLADRRPAPGSAPPVTAYATFMLDGPGDVDAVAARAQALGGRLVKAPYATYYGQWQAVLADPEGHVFRLGTDRLPPGVSAPPLPAAD
jgi:catechol 2,3-dioxygenase-like lactoylglutathione lyase family enzyme